MAGRAWTNEEKKLLIEFWKTDLPVREFYHHFEGRTWRAVEIFGRVTLGLGSRHKWTREEEEILKNIWGKPGPIKYMRDALPGRPVEGIFSVARKLGLPTVRGGLKYQKKSMLKVAIEIELKKGTPLNSRYLSKLTGGHDAQIRKILSTGHKNGEYHIVSWSKLNVYGPPAPMWLMGKAIDAPRPQAKGKAKACRESRQRRSGVTTIGNPFAAAAGLVQAPSGVRGRVYKQAMDIDEWGQSREAA